MKSFLTSLFLLTGIVLSALELPTVWTGVAGEANQPPAITIETTNDGQTVYRARPIVNGTYQGMRCMLEEVFDPREYSGIEFVARQQVATGKASVVFRLDQTAIPGSPVRQSYTVVSIGNDWEKITVPFDPVAWNAPEGADKQAPVEGLSFYPFADLSHPGVFIEIGCVALLPKNDKSARELPIARYSYINQPTTGDASCTELMDGDIRTGAYYRQYSNDAEIIFDLGAIYAVTQIDAEAFCPPGHNFTELRVTASSDNRNFSSWGVVKNTMDGGDEVEMLLSSQGYAIGRYFKVRAVKIRPDFFTWLGEIRFYGHMPDEQEKLEFQQKSYDLGPEIEDPAAGGYALLSARGIQAYVNLRNSVVNGVFFNGNRLAERLSNVYTWQTHAADTEISGYDDQVEQILEQKEDALTLLCTNPQLPNLEIIKKFYISQDGDLMLDYVVRNQELAERAFLRVATKVILTKSFRDDGFYETAGAGHYTIREQARDIMISTAACNVPYLVFENFKEDLTIFHHRHGFDGKFLYIDSVTEEEKLLFLEPNGYQMPDATFALGEAGDHEVLSRLSIVSGNILNAYDKYYDLEETRQYKEAIHRPEWLRDILLTGSCGWQAPLKGKNADFMQNVNTAFLPRGYFLDAGSGELGWEWGYYPTEGEIRDAFGSVYTPEEVTEELQSRRNVRPGSKIGLYTWLWSNPPTEGTVVQHPEWFIFKTRGGALASWFPGINTNLMRKWETPEARQQAVDMENNLIRAYNCDSIYVDGGNAGSFAKDWTTMTIDSPHAKNYLYAGLREKMQEFKPDGYLMFNAPMNPFADVGIVENFAGAMTSEWHKGALWMHKFKLFSYKDPLKSCFYIYWLSNVDGAFQNYMMGTGLLPAWFSRELTLADVPFSSARYEVRGVEIVNSRITPDYRADNDCEVETMAQTQGQDALIFVNYHGKEQVRQELTVETAPFGFAPDQTVYSYFTRFRDARSFHGTFGEPDLQKGYREGKWRSDRAMTAEYLGSGKAGDIMSKSFDLVPGQGAMWIISPVPAVIWSADDLPSHSRLSEWPDLKITGNYDCLTCTTEYSTSEIAIVIPAGQEVAFLTVDQAESDYYYVRDGKSLFAVVGLNGAGIHEISVSTRQTPKKYVWTTKESPLSSILLNAELQVSVTDGLLQGTITGSDASADVEKALSIYCDGALVYGNTMKGDSFAIPLPSTVTDGEYVVQVSRLEGTILADANITLQGFARPTPLKDLRPPVPSETKETTCRQSRPGLTMTRYGQEYTEGTGTTAVSPENMAMRVGTLPRVTTFFGTAAAGGEFTASRYCQVRLTGNFKYYNNYGAFPQDHFVYNMNNRMAGLVFDFERQTGGFVRTLADLGIVGTERSSSSPQYCGLGKVPDYFFNINNFAKDKQSDDMTFWLDFKSLGAPVDWTGKVFVSALLDNAAPNRWFQVELLQSADSLPSGAEAVKPFNRTAKPEPRTFDIPALPDGSKVTCDWDSDLWQKVPLLPPLVPLGNAGAPLQQPTQVKIAADSKTLYVLYNCIEDPDKVPETSRGARGEPYFSDCIEFWFQLAESPERVMHGIVDVAGHIFVHKSHIEPKTNSYSENYLVPPFQYQIKKVGGDWHILITIEHNILAQQNTAFNVCRSRNVDGVMDGYTLVPGDAYITGALYTIRNIQGK